MVGTAVGAGVFVRGGVGAGVVGAGVVGAAVGAAVVLAALGVGLGVGLGVALGVCVVGAAVRIWAVALGDGDADGLGDGELDAPAKRDRPPPSITPMSRSVTRPPATAARIRSIQRGPRRGGGMIFVVSDMGRSNRRLRAGQTYAQVA